MPKFRTDNIDSSRYYPGTGRIKTPPPKNPRNPDKLQSTPVLNKPGNSTSLAASFDKSIQRDKLKDIHKGVENEVMHATIENDPHLLNNTFPDAIFGASRHQLDISLQCRQQTKDGAGKSNSGSNSAASESRQPFETNASPPDHTRPSDTHPRRSGRLAQQIQANKSTTKRTDTSKPSLSPLEHMLRTKMCKPERRLPYYAYKKWHVWPKTSQEGAEEGVAAYLNELVGVARRFFNNGVPVPDRDDDFVFSARYATKAIKNKRARRKPDIVLVPRHHADAKESQGWGDVRAIGELKKNAKVSKKTIRGELAERARLCFGSQPSRRFVLAFSLLDTKMSLWRFDRSGAIVSQEFDVHKEPIAFLHAILGLALGHDYFVGYDPSFTHEGDKHFVELNGGKYEVLETIKLDDVIRGRGTVVQRVRDDKGRELIMKDQWVDRSRATKEFKMLEALEEMGVQKVPRLVDYQLVTFKVGDEVVIDSTGNDRVHHAEKCEKDGIETRDHYRLLITPFGDKLGSFMSLRELLSVFRDFVEGVRDVRENEIVHRDMSLGNLILVHEDDASPCRRGYLIDFDYAVYVTQIGRAIAERTGTLPFIAIDILLKMDVKHEYYHDLESLFYVLIWILFTHESPGVKRRDFDFKESPLYQWMGGNSENPNMTTIAESKTAHMRTASGFKRFILDKLPDYFKQSEALTDFLDKLRDIMFRETPLSSGAHKGRVVTEEEKGMNDRNRHDVFQQIFDVFDEAIHRIETEATPANSGEEPPSASGENEAAALPADVPDGIQLRPLNCLPVPEEKRSASNRSE